MASDEVWKSSALTKTYLEGVRGAIPLAGEQIEVILRLLGAGGHPVRRAVDLGCGDGVLAAAILDRWPEADITLVDFSRPMLEAAQKRFAVSKASVRFLLTDYAAPDWVHAVRDAAPFDAVVSGYSIHHQPDARKRELYREIFGLLRSGGLFVNLEHVASASAWVESVHDALFVDSLSRAQPHLARTEVEESYRGRPDKDANILATVEVQCTWLREIGFADVDCYLKVFELAVFGGRRP